MRYVHGSRREAGFSLIEVMVSLLITLLVMSSVFLLLRGGQRSFTREAEVSDMSANARAGLDRISTDLTIAGFKTPPNLAVMWNDGGGTNPDELTIVYADPEVPVSRPKPCGSGGSTGNSGSGGNGGNDSGGGPCNTIGMSATLNIDPYSMDPQPLDYENAYKEGMMLFAIQGPNGEPECDNVPPAIIPFELTQPPKCTGAGGATSGPAGCATLNLNHNPGNGELDINPPNGFDGDVTADCAIIGMFHLVQYRINPLPPSDRPALERRDVAMGEDWTPLAANIENLQVLYSQGFGNDFLDEPVAVPVGADPNTWITGVRVTVAGRSASTRLEGASAGVVSVEDTFLRRSYATTVSLRNQLGYALNMSTTPSWN